MKRINAIIYTLLAAVLCISLYTNFEQADRAGHAREAIDYYELATQSYEESNEAYGIALLECNMKLRRSEAYTMIDCKLESISDNLEHISIVVDKNKEIDNLTQQLNITNISLTECLAEPCTVVKRTTSYKSRYNNCIDDLEEYQTTDSNECPECDTCEECTDCGEYEDALYDISDLVRPSTNYRRNEIINVLDSVNIN